MECEKEEKSGMRNSVSTENEPVNCTACELDELEPFGNGQVPQCAAEAWRLLT